MLFRILCINIIYHINYIILLINIQYYILILYINIIYYTLDLFSPKLNYFFFIRTIYVILINAKF